MGWKQSDLAVRLKTSRAAIAGWENNMHRPHPLVLDKIVELTGYPLEFFIGSDDEDGNGDELSRRNTQRESCGIYVDNIRVLKLAA